MHYTPPPGPTGSAREDRMGFSGRQPQGLTTTNGCICIHTHMYIYICISLHVPCFVYKHFHMYIYICICICIRTCICVCIHIYIYMYAYIHIFTCKHIALFDAPAWIPKNAAPFHLVHPANPLPTDTTVDPSRHHRHKVCTLPCGKVSEVWVPMPYVVCGHDGFIRISRWT